MKIAIGITKNWIPPHAEIAIDNNIPPLINLKNDKLDFSFFIPLKNKYRDKIPKQSPRGSDLNQPKVPLKIMGNETENKSDDNIPALVPAIILTKRKTKNVVTEPKITGMIIVKS